MKFKLYDFTFEYENKVYVVNFTTYYQPPISVSEDLASVDHFNRRAWAIALVKHLQTEKVGYCPLNDLKDFVLQQKLDNLGWIFHEIGGARDTNGHTINLHNLF